MARMYRGRGRSSGRRAGWNRPAVTPNRRMARTIVKKAGPMERSFWLDSSQANYGDSPSTTYANGEQFYDQKVYQLFGPNDYQQDAGSRERVLVRRLEFRSVFLPPRNFTDGTHPLQGNELGFMLVRGPASVLSNYFDAGFGDANPWGSQGSVTAYEQLPREVKVLARKVRTYRAGIQTVSSISGGVLPGEDPIAIYLANLQGQPFISSMTLRAKNFWLQEPESVWVVSYRRATKSSTQDADEIGPWVGEHTVQCSFARY